MKWILDAMFLYTLVHVGMTAFRQGIGSAAPGQDDGLLILAVITVIILKAGGFTAGLAPTHPLIYAG